MPAYLIKRQFTKLTTRCQCDSSSAVVATILSARNSEVQRNMADSKGKDSINHATGKIYIFARYKYAVTAIHHVYNKSLYVVTRDLISS